MFCPPVSSNFAQTVINELSNQSRKSCSHVRDYNYNMVEFMIVGYKVLLLRFGQSQKKLCNLDVKLSMISY